MGEEGELVVDVHACGLEGDKLDPEQREKDEGGLVDHEMLLQQQQHDLVEDAYSGSQLLQN